MAFFLSFYLILFRKHPKQETGMLWKATKIQHWVEPAEELEPGLTKAGKYGNG